MAGIADKISGLPKAAGGAAIGILKWAKSHPVSIVLILVAVLLPPAGIVAASFWNDAIQAQAKEAYEGEQRDLRRSATVRYVIPPITPGDPGWEENRAPNRALIEFVQSERQRRQEQIEEVVTRAVRFNKPDERRVLVQGLFPAAENEQAERDLIEGLVDRIDRGGQQPSVFAAMFDELNAGAPPDQAGIAQRVVGLAESERERMLGVGEGAQLSEEDAETLRNAVTAVRVQAYQDAALELGVYGGLEALIPGVDDATATGFSAASDPGQPWSARPPASVLPIDGLPRGERATLAQAFVWQWDVWIIEDILRAVQRVNRTSGGLAAEVPFAPVKRIEAIRVDLPVSEVASGGSGLDRDRDPVRGERGGRGGRGGQSPFGAPTDLPTGGGEEEAAVPVVGATPPATHTGRASTPDNKTYDVRTASLTAIVDPTRLIEIMEAFSSTNFMTVVGLRVEEIDRAAHLAEGRFYGEGPVVRAELLLETAWLRFWTRDAMPAPIRTALGVADPTEATEAEGEDG